MISIVPARLVARMEALGMTQSAVARAIGVKPPSISRLVKGKHAQTRHIFGLARAVRTTPEYLTGITDDPEDNSLPDLTFEQRQLLACFDSMDRTDQEMLLAMAMRLAERTNPGRVHAHLQSYRPEPAGG